MKAADVSLRLGISFLRPVPIAFEWFFLEGAHEIASSFPIVMLALAVSSIPVHRKLYQLNINDPLLTEEYQKRIALITTLSLMLLSIILLILNFRCELIILICSWFVVEKACDELARNYTYRKNIFGWAVVQTSRSTWLLPLLAALLVLTGSSAKNFLLIYPVTISGLVAVVFLFNLKWNRKLFPTTRDCLDLIKLSPYLSSSILSGIIRQGPRLAVNNALPQMAHLYILATQFSQVVQLIYNVFYHIPYRKIISKRPFLYLANLGHVNRFLEYIALALLAISMALLMCDQYSAGIILGALSESMLLAILNNKIIVLIWIVGPIRQLKAIWAPAVTAPLIYISTLLLLQEPNHLAYLFLLQFALITLTSHIIAEEISGQEIRNRAI